MRKKKDLLDEIDESESKIGKPPKEPKPKPPAIEKKMPRSRKEAEPIAPPPPSLDTSPPTPTPPLPFEVDFVPTPGLAPDPKYIEAIVKHVDKNVSKKQKPVQINPANAHQIYPIAVKKFVDAKNAKKRNKKR